MEQVKASIRAKVEHPFRVIKRRFGHVKVRYRGLGEEHRAAAHAVRAVQSVDGAPTTDGRAGMSASAVRGGVKTPSAGRIPARKSFTAADRNHLVAFITSPRLQSGNFEHHPLASKPE